MLSYIILSLHYIVDYLLHLEAVATETEQLHFKALVSCQVIQLTSGWLLLLLLTGLCD